MRSAAAAFTLALLLPGDARAAVARQGQVVMGTVLTVTVVAAEQAAAEAAARAAIDEARLWDDALTIWRPEGELAQLVAKAGSASVAIGPRLARGLDAMVEMSEYTGGAFDPAIAMWPRIAGTEEKYRRITQILTLEDWSSDKKPLPRRAKLEAGGALDPGGIGKGLAIDAMVALLREKGITSAFIDFGGSSQTAIGTAPDSADGWPVVVTGASAGEAVGRLKLRDASISTSRSGATDTTPILEPRSGRPVPAGRIVTVRGPEATTADAWSTALVVIGPPAIPRASRRGLEVLIDDLHGRTVTPDFGLTP